MKLILAKLSCLFNFEIVRGGDFKGDGGLEKGFPKKNILLLKIYCPKTLLLLEIY